MTEISLSRPWHIPDWLKLTTLGLLGGYILMFASVTGNVFSVNVTTPGVGEGDGDLSNGEAWCDENAANCVCSEPLTAELYIRTDGRLHTQQPRVGVDSWNPNDTTTNECGFESEFHPFRTYSHNVTPSDEVTPNNPTGLAINDEAYSTAALPNRVAEFTPRFIGQPYTGAYRGTNWVAHDYKHITSGDFRSFKGRRSYRWYTWYPSDFINTTGGQQNGKKWQSLIGSYWTSGPERMNHHAGTHGWKSSDGGVGECGRLRMHSGKSGVNYDAAYYQAVWTRVEIIVDQISNGTGDPGTGNGTRIRWMFKNITRDDAEVTFTDSFNISTDNRPSGGTWDNTNPNGPSIDNGLWDCGGQTDVWRLGEDFEQFRQNHFGQNNDGVTANTPWRGFAYIQVAAWTQEEMDAAGFDLYGADVWNTTDFRIGSAFEMEGVAGIIDP